MEDPQHLLSGMADLADHIAPDRSTDVDLVEACRRCESPAERALLIALIGVPIPMHVTLQKTIGVYRADFAFESTHHRLVVEVDGHQWHQATQDQVARDHARDRYLLTHGWPVMRFTALEAFRDGPSCAAEIVRYLERAA